MKNSSKVFHPNPNDQDILMKPEQFFNMLNINFPQ